MVEGFNVNLFITNFSRIITIGGFVIALVAYIVNLHNDLNALTAKVHVLEALSDHRYEATDVRISNVVQHVIEIDKNTEATEAIIRNEVSHLSEQQLRMIQALDNTYNLLNEHLRNHGNEKRPPPVINGGPP